MIRAMKPLNRRSFLRSSGGAALAAALTPVFADAADPVRRLIAHPGGLPHRILGKTGRPISVIGFPGLALSRVTQAEADTAVRGSFEQGMNYFDVAPAYGNGRAEIALGPALALCRATKYSFPARPSAATPRAPAPSLRNRCGG